MINTLGEVQALLLGFGIGGILGTLFVLALVSWWRDY